MSRNAAPKHQNSRARIGRAQGRNRAVAIGLSFAVVAFVSWNAARIMLTNTLDKDDPRAQKTGKSGTGSRWSGDKLAGTYENNDERSNYR
jgi:hypothetical protein